jgi:hypothetical protein
MTWESDFPGGKQVVLNIIDSLGSSGGTSQLLVTRGDGDCVDQGSSGAFSVSVNVTDRLETCQPWEITASGGTPPYTFVIAAPDAPVVSNVTSTLDANRFTYINRAYPDGQVFVAVADSTEQYASGTPIVATYGPSDFKCGGATNTWQSSSGSVIDPDNGSQSSTTATVALAVVIPVGMLIVLTIAFVVYRRRKQRKEKEIQGDTNPYLLDRPPGAFPPFRATLPPSKGLPAYTDSIGSPISGSDPSSSFYPESTGVPRLHRPPLRMVNEANEEIDLAHLVNVLQNAQEPPPPYATEQTRQTYKPPHGTR